LRLKQTSKGPLKHILALLVLFVLLVLLHLLVFLLRLLHTVIFQFVLQFPKFKYTETSVGITIPSITKFL
jgi:hypothetical protein